MKAYILAAAVTLTLAGSAFAAPGASNAKFCLRFMGGAAQGTETCAYQTMKQCMAAKTGGNDICIANSGRGKS